MVGLLYHTLSVAQVNTTNFINESALDQTWENRSALLSKLCYYQENKDTGFLFMIQVFPLNIRNWYKEIILDQPKQCENWEKYGEEISFFNI